MYVNNIEMPVTLYLSSDDQAPVLTNANLSVILKACLVTGYGSKTGAGWTLPYEDAASNTRVFAPKHAGELDSYLRIKDSGGGDSIVQAYREMTGIDAGDKILELITPYKYGQSNLKPRWAVLASERSVIMWVDSAAYAGPRIGQMLFYGDSASAHDCCWHTVADMLMTALPPACFTPTQISQHRRRVTATKVAPRNRALSPHSVTVLRHATRATSARSCCCGMIISMRCPVSIPTACPPTT